MAWLRYDSLCEKIVLGLFLLYEKVKVAVKLWGLFSEV